jgi:AcrR family transcriptional regulator
LIEQDGLSISTKRIADAAGIAEGTVFRAFPTKEALLKDALTSYLDPTDSIAAINAIDRSLTLEDKVARVVEIVWASASRIHIMMMALHRQRRDASHLDADRGAWSDDRRDWATGGDPWCDEDDPESSDHRSTSRTSPARTQSPDRRSPYTTSALRSRLADPGVSTRLTANFAESTRTVAASDRPVGAPRRPVATSDRTVAEPDSLAAPSQAPVSGSWHVHATHPFRRQTAAFRDAIADVLVANREDLAVDPVEAASYLFTTSMASVMMAEAMPMSQQMLVSLTLRAVRGVAPLHVREGS